MKIVVTGGLGHIGSKLIRKIPVVIPEAEVTILDNLCVQRYCSLFHLPENGKYRFVSGDILEDGLEDIFRGADAVVHLAANTEPELSVDKLKEVEEINYIGTKKVADCCEKLGIPMFFPSSTSVYGSNALIVDENTQVTTETAQSPYAKSKVKAEEYLKELGREKGLQFTVCRFGTIFGISEGMRFHTAVNKFTWQACTQQPITVWKTAYHQRRPYLDIDDAISAICFILHRSLFKNQIYNIVTANLTVKDIVDIIERYIDNLDINFVESKIMNQLSYDVSCDKILGEGFEITGSIEQGIKDTVYLLKGIAYTKK